MPRPVRERTVSPVGVLSEQKQRARDLHQNHGYNSLRASRKGGRREAMAINSQTIALLRAYLERAGHSADIDGPLFRPLRPNGERWNKHRGIDADACAMRNCRLQHPSQLS
jgi:hypothetical protein